jgi:hypothetical protein
MMEGEGLCTVLFNIALHSVINKTDPKGTLFLKAAQICAYADDLVIVTTDANTLKQIHLELEREIQGIGLSVKERRPSI